jgi:hypothetical protein
VSDEDIREINEAFARLEELQEAYRRRFPDGRLGPPRDSSQEEATPAAEEPQEVILLPGGGNYGSMITRAPDGQADPLVREPKQR